MLVAEISIARPVDGKQLDPERETDDFHGLLAAWWHNGQIAWGKWTILKNESGLSAQVTIYAEDALDASYDRPFVTSARERALAAYGCEPQIRMLGLDPDNNEPCDCEEARDYILFTAFTHRGSPVRCAECFHPVPLYRMPMPDKHDYMIVHRWVSDYHACDTLQIGCTVGERFGEQQMSRLESDLTQSGLVLCHRWEELLGCKVYYFLNKFRTRSYKAELKRLCPGCGQAWLLDEPLHRIFSFRCDDCRLLSNIAWGY